MSVKECNNDEYYFDPFEEWLLKQDYRKDEVGRLSRYLNYGLESGVIPYFPPPDTFKWRDDVYETYTQAIKEYKQLN